MGSRFNIGDTVCALYDFAKQQPEDLNLWSNDILRIVDNNVGEGWLLAQNIHSMEQGLIPENYVELQAPAPAPAVFRPPPPPVPSNQNQQKDFFYSEEYDDFDDFDSDDDDESVTGGSVRGAKTPNRKVTGPRVGGANLISRLANTPGAAVTDFIAGVHLPAESPRIAAMIEFYDSRPLWKQTGVFHINFGKRKESSKIGGIKKFQVYAVTPTSTNRTVLRRYKHFDWLYHRLTEQFPGIAIPPLPDAKVTGHDDAFIQDREQKLMEWANKMSTHPVICESEVFNHFVSVSEKDEKKWKNGKRRAEKEPFKGMNSYLAVEGESANLSVINSKRVLPALEAYSKYSTDVEKHSKVAMNAARGLAMTHRATLKSSYQGLGKSLSSLGALFKKGLSGNYTDLIYFPDISPIGNAFESVGAMYGKIADLYENQPEKDFEVVENALWVQTGTLEHIPSMHKMNAVASEACASKSNASDEGSVERLTKIHAATLAEVNHIQLNSPSQYKNMIKVALEEQINFYKSLINILEPQLQVIENVNV